MTDPSKLKLSDGTAKLRAAMIAAIAVSIGGIAYAVLFGVAADGGRGGAIAVALTFFMFFMGRGTAEDALEARLPETGDPAVDADAELARVRGAGIGRAHGRTQVT